VLELALERVLALGLVQVLALVPEPEQGLGLALVPRKQIPDYQGLKLLPSKRKYTFS
jgi:hypothetical protein